MSYELNICPFKALFIYLFIIIIIIIIIILNLELDCDTYMQTVILSSSMECDLAITFSSYCKFC